uniref:7-dehydrocholesterol reductase n=1 Tax=Panagrellus redivivus TaxID=6233 RepID=A0A7E4VP17_PANRE
MRVSRRSSSFGSGSLVGRRSSLCNKDVERIQQIVQRRRKPSPQLVFLAVAAAPVLALYLTTACRHLNEDPRPLFEVHSGDLYQAVSLFIAVFIIQLIFLCILPSDDYELRLPSGDKTIINANSFISCLLICLLYIFGASLKFYPGTLMYENFIYICALLSVVAIGLAFYLHQRAASEESTSDPFLIDFVYGRELQPSILDIDVKNLITQRLMLTFWALYILSAVWHSYDIRPKQPSAFYAIVTLQLLYIARRQWTEHLAYTNLDAQNDRAGFYRLWGVGVFLLMAYVSPVSVLANITKPTSSASRLLTWGLVIVNLISQWVNSATDLQKYQFRASNGKMKIGETDPFFISAKYKSENNEPAVSLLLGSGYHASCRHLNYTTEFLTFLTWTILQKNSPPITYLPLAVVGAVLLYRMYCDETRCLIKYGQYWIQYCNKVKYLLIPGVY